MSAPDDLVVRAATDADAATLDALALRLTAFALPPWRTADEIATADARDMRAAVAAAAPDRDVFIAERQGVPVGGLYVLLVTDFFGRRHAHISVIAATETAEGTGVGRALLAYAEAWARTRQVSLLTLNVFAANDRARRFYEQAGFLPELIKYVKPL